MIAAPAGRGLGDGALPRPPPLPLSLDDQGCGISIWPNNRTGGKRQGLLLFPWLSEGPEWQGRPGGRIPEPSHWGPHTHPWMLALLAEDRSQSHVLEGHVGTECLSAPLGQGGSPHPPSGGSHSGSHRMGGWFPGRVGLGAHQGLGLLGLRKASEREGGGRLRRHLETEVQPGLVAPPPGHSQEATRRHGVKSRCLYSGCITWSLSQAWTAPYRATLSSSGLHDNGHAAHRGCARWLCLCLF